MTIEHFPPRDTTRDELTAPVVQVTLLEDRASVMRRGTIELMAGQNRLYVAAVAPVLQDVSVRGRALGENAQVSDALVRRAIRVRREHKPDEVRELEAAIRDATRQFQELAQTRERHEARWQQVQQMLLQGIQELPEDAAWGVIDTDGWQETFSQLFERSRSLYQRASDVYFEQIDLNKEIQSLGIRRALLDRPDQHFVAWLELDVVAKEAGPVTLELEYVVPNALWRPLHRARLEDESKLRFTSRAAVWQNTGEDWEDVALVFSTARSSLGTEPPLLHDDLLSAQRKSEELVVQARQVEVQSASVPKGGGGGAPAPNTVDLPGVDDGGEVQNLRPEGTYTMPSNGEPHFVDLFTFVDEPKVSRVLMAELVPRVLLKSVQNNRHNAPILAGPVELMQDSGAVGWTQTLFVAPGETFELGFGPQDDIRVHRDMRIVSNKVDEVDKWTRKVTEVRVYLSNLGDHTRDLEITERIPVSEIEQVVISVDDKETTPHMSLDENGFGTWTGPIEAHERSEVRLRWTMATAPDVKGL